MYLMGKFDLLIIISLIKVWTHIFYTAEFHLPASIDFIYCSSYSAFVVKLFASVLSIHGYILKNMYHKISILDLKSTSIKISTDYSIYQTLLHVCFWNHFILGQSVVRLPKRRITRLLLSVRPC